MKKEQRVSARKVLRVRGMVTIEGGARMEMRTVDVSREGACACLPRPLAAGLRCQLNWAMLLNGSPRTVAVSATVVYCVLGGCDDNTFRAGFQFVNVSAADAATLASYVG